MKIGQSKRHIWLPNTKEYKSPTKSSKKGIHSSIVLRLIGSCMLLLRRLVLSSKKINNATYYSFTFYSCVIFYLHLAFIPLKEIIICMKKEKE